MSANSRPENVIGTGVSSGQCQRVLERLRRNDPDLKEMNIDVMHGWRGLLPERVHQAILEAFQAIATSTSLVILNIDDYLGLPPSLFEDAITALSRNTSLRDIRITLCSGLSNSLDIIMSSPNLQALTIRTISDDYLPSVDEITALARVLHVNTKLHSLTVEGFMMDCDEATAFSRAFHVNRTIKTLTMRYLAISAAGAVCFAQALPQNHSLESIVFDTNWIDDNSAVRIVHSLCSTPLKALSLVGSSAMTPFGCGKIIRTLLVNKHNFTKLELFYDCQDSPWQNNIRRDIDILTWHNQLQVEKHTWADWFLNQNNRTRERICLYALERAKKVDKDRFSKAPNMLFYLVREMPDLIAQSFLGG